MGRLRARWRRLSGRSSGPHTYCENACRGNVGTRSGAGSAARFQGDQSTPGLSIDCHRRPKIEHHRDRAERGRRVNSAILEVIEQLAFVAPASRRPQGVDRAAPIDQLGARHDEATTAVGEERQPNRGRRLDLILAQVGVAMDRSVAAQAATRAKRSGGVGCLESGHGGRRHVRSGLASRRALAGLSPQCSTGGRRCGAFL